MRSALAFHVGTIGPAMLRLPHLRGTLNEVLV